MGAADGGTAAVIDAVTVGVSFLIAGSTAAVGVETTGGRGTLQPTSRRPIQMAENSRLLVGTLFVLFKAHGVHLLIHTLLLQQLLMLALLNYLPMMHNHDPVGADHGREPVGNHK